MKFPFAGCALLSLCMLVACGGASVQHDSVPEVRAPAPTLAFAPGPWAYRRTQAGRATQTFVVVRDLDGELAAAHSLTGRMLAFPRSIRLKPASRWFALGDMGRQGCHAVFRDGTYQVRCELEAPREGETIVLSGEFDERLGAYRNAIYEVFDETGSPTQPPLRIELDAEASREARAAQQLIDQAATDATADFDVFVASHGAAAELRLFATLDAKDMEARSDAEAQVRQRLAMFHRNAHPSDVPQVDDLGANESEPPPSLDEARAALLQNDFNLAWRYLSAADDPRPLIDPLLERLQALSVGLDLTRYAGHLGPRSVAPTVPTQSDHLENVIYYLQRVTFRAHGADESAWRRFVDEHGTEPYVEWARRGTSPDVSPYSREAAIRYLEQNSSETALAVLSSLLGDADLTIRLDAATALAERGRVESAPVLVRLLRSRDSRIFEGALEALGHLRDTTLGLAEAASSTEELMAIARFEVWAERLQHAPEGT